MKQLFLMTVIALFFVSSAIACNLPVFRYALEYWAPDIYEINIVHEGELSPQDQQIVDHLRDISYGSPSNIAVNLIDAGSNPGDPAVKRWKELLNRPSPWMEVNFPAALGIGESIWSGELNDENVDRILNSQLRSQIARQILAGESAVWVVIEGGDPERDNAVSDMLIRHLKKAEETLVLPEPDEFFDDYNIEIKISFPVVRLSPDDPEEAFLARMLLYGVDRSDDPQEPIVSPIFGRGRALCALFADDLDEESVMEVAAFLVGRCSCQVKELNPGRDLLFTFDWDAVLTASITGYPTLVNYDEETIEMQKAEEESASHFRRNTIVAIGVQGLIILLAAFLILSRRWRKRVG